jgi:hypothetical protein
MSTHSRVLHHGHREHKGGESVGLATAPTAATLWVAACGAVNRTCLPGGHRAGLSLERTLQPLCHLGTLWFHQQAGFERHPATARPPRSVLYDNSGIELCFTLPLNHAPPRAVFPAARLEGKPVMKDASGQSSASAIHPMGLVARLADLVPAGPTAHAGLSRCVANPVIRGPLR